MPILYPVIIELNFDPIWFGIILVILIELGLITPPVGINLFVIHGISGNRPMGEIILGVIPYIFILLFAILVLYFFPSIALLLPNRIM
jgi:C4-dicarboxylate transporter DctM subunit